MDAESKRIKEQIKNLPFKDRMANYWNYYKVHTFVAIACILIFGTSIVQCATQIKYDMTVALYTSKGIADEQIAEITELLKAQCQDITGDEAVNVTVNPSVADINGKMDEMSMAILQKLQAELAANTSAGYVVDEAYRSLLVDSYGCPAENVIEISKVPVVRERLKLEENDKLYWVPGFKSREKKEISQFNNGERVEEFFKNNME